MLCSFHHCNKSRKSWTPGYASQTLLNPTLRTIGMYNMTWVKFWAGNNNLVLGRKSRAVLDAGHFLSRYSLSARPPLEGSRFSFIDRPVKYIVSRVELHFGQLWSVILLFCNWFCLFLNCHFGFFVWPLLKSQEHKVFVNVFYLSRQNYSLEVKMIKIKWVLQKQPQKHRDLSGLQKNKQNIPLSLNTACDVMSCECSGPRLASGKVQLLRHRFKLMSSLGSLCIYKTIFSCMTP